MEKVKRPLFPKLQKRNGCAVKNKANEARWDRNNPCFREKRMGNPEKGDQGNHAEGLR
jgi:hypothetical protein